MTTFFASAAAGSAEQRVLSGFTTGLDLVLPSSLTEILQEKLNLQWVNEESLSATLFDPNPYLPTVFENLESIGMNCIFDLTSKTDFLEGKAKS